MSVKKVMGRIIHDESIDIVAPDERKRIGRMLLLAGGGILQTFFSMGAVKCLVDNGMFYDRKKDVFYFEVISAISGGTLLLFFIDLATNPQYSYHKQADWYNKYVRTPVYRFARTKIIPTGIWGVLNKDLEKRIFDLVPEYNHQLTVVNSNIECLYNYIDANTQLVSHDHSDLIDISKNFRVPFWYVIRLLRCAIPFTNFNGKGTYDAGAVSNIPIATAFKTFSPKDTFVVVAQSHLIYATYPEQTLLDIGLSTLRNIINGANHSINGLLDVMIDKRGRNLCCSMPNELNESGDVIHRKLVKDIGRDVSKTVRYYNGLLFRNLDSLKLIENIGYTQMHEQINKYCGGKRRCVFAIPNPDVYDKARASAIYEELKTISPMYEIMAEFFSI